MKKLLFWIVLIVGTVALLGSCAKKEESTTAAAAAAGVCTTCDPLTSTTTAAGSITVGSATLSGTYATSCFTDASDFSEGSAPSDMKSYGFLFIVRGNDNVTEELKILHAQLKVIQKKMCMIMLQLEVLPVQTIKSH